MHLSKGLWALSMNKYKEEKGVYERAYDATQYVTPVVHCWGYTWGGTPDRWKYLSAGFCPLGKSRIDACIGVGFFPPCEDRF